MSERRDDARAHPRQAVELLTELRVDGEVHAARTRDLSLGGVSVYSERALERGKGIAVRVALTYGAASSARIELGARVVWCTQLAADRYQIGARFEQMSGGVRRQLAGFLRQVKVATPKSSAPMIRGTATSTADRFDVGEDF